MDIEFDMSPNMKLNSYRTSNLSPIRKRLFDDEDYDMIHRMDHQAPSPEVNFVGIHDKDEDDYENRQETEKENKICFKVECNGKSCSPVSPPYKRIKSLQVYSSTPYNGRKTPPNDLDRSTGIEPAAYSPRFLLPRYRSLRAISPINNSSHNSSSKLLSDPPTNPFTPTGRLIVSADQKRRKDRRNAFSESISKLEDSSSGTHSSDIESEMESKSILGPSLNELETSRFIEEFRIDSFIACGSFGKVYKCTNFLNGMVYAVKKSCRAIVGTNYEHRARREIFAHAALKAHQHIVSYYSSWIQEGHIYIQTEYCNAGSLDKLISGGSHVFTESGLRRLINHISKGLKFIHDQGLAHMDIKPANIFIDRVANYEASEEECDDEDHDDIDLVYKIGDLGHLTVMNDPDDVEDGDCRYMPKELLNEDYSNLDKVDIFSFGMTLLETASGEQLPKNGDTWQDLRSGKVPYLYKFSSYYNQLIKSMLHPDPAKRPDINYVLQKTRKTADDLQREICSYKMKRDFYAQKAHARVNCLKTFNIATKENTNSA